MYKLSREELRIIEQTKQEGAQEPPRPGVRIWSLVAWVAIFVLFVLGIRLFVAWVG